MGMIANHPESEVRVLVVAESDSCWTSWRSQSAGDTFVITQQLDEEQHEFAQRAVQRIERLIELGWRPRTAVLAVNQSATNDAYVARTPIARALIGSLRGAEGDEFVLAGDTRFPDEARHGLLGLVQMLAESLVGLPIDIRVQFTCDTAPSPRRPSGIRPIAPLSSARVPRHARSRRRASA
jgi:hypothetical protein